MPQPNKSLREKTAARLVAIQLIYSYKSQQKQPNANKMLNDVEAFKQDDQQAEFSAVFKEKPHAPSLKKLLEGYSNHYEILQPMAVESLHENWKPERVNPLLLVILELAIFELDHHRELADAIIINEYTDIAARLLDARDVDFLHANLKRLVGKLRG